ncbi:MULTISPECIES: serine/threonine-protein phosphatase [Streptomyces]|uniref:Uncharacterized protein n=1 Tax=Streptomyces canarius TaxID=285453 RepID=A0ABQ3CMF5_9ACTN|nr:serine/threonine-protein phosphatase [Streptomyces canarius]GHA28484.1 hypothetical protein GCM10010345_36490 [Streptomyces canarius]
MSARCTLAGAGYPALTVLQPDGVVTTVDIPAHPPLGQAPSPMQAIEFDLPDRSLLLLHAHTPWTPDPAAVAGPTALAEAGLGSTSRLTDLSRSALNAPLSDRRYAHAGVLAARTHTFDGDNVASWDLADDLAAVSHARKHVWAKLTAWGLEDAGRPTPSTRADGDCSSSPSSPGGGAHAMTPAARPSGRRNNCTHQKKPLPAAGTRLRN